MIYRRNSYLKVLNKTRANGRAKMITGVRGSGKTTILRQFAEEIGALYTDCAWHPDMLSLEQDLMDRLEGRFCTVILDNVENVMGWESTVVKLLDKDHDVYVVLPDRSCLKGELSPRLAGKYVELRVYPLSYREFLDMHQLEDSPESFDSYIQNGGMPSAYNNPQVLEDIQMDILKRDFFQRRNLREITAFRNAVEAMYKGTGVMTNLGDIAERTGVPKDDLKLYSPDMMDNFLLVRADGYDITWDRDMKKGRFYAPDHAMLKAVDPEADDMKVLQNMVYLELLRRGFKVRSCISQGKPVDFMAVRGEDKTYYHIGIDGTEDISALEIIPDDLPKIYLVKEEISSQKKGNITIESIREWLIKK